MILTTKDPLGKTKLIVEPTDEQVLTPNREGDAASSIARGLAEYVHALESDVDGTKIRFQQVFSVWADPEDLSSFPSAVVNKEGTVEYGDSSFTPQFPAAELVGLSGAYLVTPCELDLTIALEMWTTQIRERERILAMMEDAIFPVSWMCGFTLELPHYFNARATFLPTGAMFEDGSNDAKTRIRKVTQRFSVKMPVYRLLTGIPKAEGRVRLSLTTTIGGQ